MKHLSSLVVFVSLAWSAASAAHAADGAAPPPPPAPPAPSAYAVAYATPANSGDPCCLRCPQWTISLGAWFYGMDGTIAAGGRTVDVDRDFTDSFENLDEIGFEGRVRLATNKWRFTLGADGTTISDSAGTPVDAEFSVWTAYATIGYVIAGGRTDCSACAGTWCLDLFAGVRFYSVGVDIAGTPGGGLAAPIAGLAAVDRSEEWFDPIVGLHLDVTWPKWYVMLEGDIGGFDVGSELAWNLIGTVGYRFGCNFSVYAGWHIRDTDFSDGDFVYDVTQSGPIVGIALTF